MGRDAIFHRLPATKDPWASPAICQDCAVNGCANVPATWRLDEAIRNPTFFCGCCANTNAMYLLVAGFHVQRREDGQDVDLVPLLPVPGWEFGKTLVPEARIYKPKGK